MRTKGNKHRHKKTSLSTECINEVFIKLNQYVDLFNWTHCREQNNVTDGVAVSEQHHHTVDTNTQTCGWWQTVFQRSHIVFIIEHCFIITFVFRTNLILEAFSLIFRIIQLGETVTDFTTADEEFKAVSDERIIIVTTCQRRNLCWIFGDEGWLNQVFSAVSSKISH